MLAYGNNCSNLISRIHCCRSENPLKPLLDFHFTFVNVNIKNWSTISRTLFCLRLVAGKEMRVSNIVHRQAVGVMMLML